jgi:hypothetical protein
MIELLKKVIDTKGYKHSLSRHFCFTWVQYDRFLNKIPKLTDWIITGEWLQAGPAANYPAFTFVKKEAA